MNVGTLLTKAARTFPDRLALVHGEKRRTYREFDARANRLANALRRLGVRPGEHVAVLQYNYPETLESLFGCFKAGCGAVPINFRLHPREWAYIVDHSEARAVILSPEFNEPLREVRPLLPGVRHLVTLGGAAGELLDYEALLAGEPDAGPDAEVHPDDAAWLFYTSGTTGRPKGAVLTHRNLLAMTMNFFADMAPLGPDDAVLHAAPLSHGSGLYALPNVAKAATNVILPARSFDPEVVLRTIEEHRVTNLFAAPTMVKLLVESPWVDRYDHSSLRCLNYGGGPAYVEDLKRALGKLGPCLVQLYGQGESPMTITYLPARDHRLEGTPAELRRLASAGIARTDVEVRVVDEADRELPPGEVGEVVTRSDLVMKGYWKDPDATAAALRGGWLHTGDLGCLDEQGYLYLLDRSKDLIITGGENVYPREVEEVLLQHPAVQEAAVIGVPDPEWGERILAYVVRRPGAVVDEAELVARCRAHLAGYKKPRSVVFLAELPKNNYGKVLKRELREGHWGDRARRV
ncbi:MAG: long-chain-fatty-acid--CoA ligase [Deferrisomatales bacterium]